MASAAHDAEGPSGRDRDDGPPPVQENAAAGVPVAVRVATGAVAVLAFANTVVRYLVTGSWRTDERIAREPFWYPWEIRRYARRHELTPEQLLGQFERFHRARAEGRRPGGGHPGSDPDPSCAPVPAGLSPRSRCRSWSRSSAGRAGSGGGPGSRSRR